VAALVLGFGLVSPACAYTRTELADYEQKELKKGENRKII
jgi:hypothetical protein